MIKEVTEHYALFLNHVTLLRQKIASILIFSHYIPQILICITNLIVQSLSIFGSEEV